MNARGAWVYSYSSNQWYYFSALCCSHFYIDWVKGDLCYNVNGECNALRSIDPSVSSNQNSSTLSSPSMSSLTQVCQFSLIMDENGNGTIQSEGKRVIVLTPEGIRDFFSERPCFYTSNEAHVEVIDGSVTISNNRTPIINVKEGVEPKHVVSLGELNEEQVSIIKKISQQPSVESRQKIALALSPNPASQHISVRFNADVAQKCKMSLVNLSGSVLSITEFTCIQGQNETEINTRVCIPGTYFMLLEISGIVLSEQFVKY
jgi:hypothetical protein